MSSPQSRLSRDAFLYEIRLQFAASLGRPRLVERPRCEHDKRMEAHWLRYAHDCGRPAYNEARGFTHDRWGKRGAASIKGCEKPYGPFSRAHWRYVWLAMKAAWWSGWNEAVGTTYKTTPPGARRDFAVLTGLTT